MKARHEYKHSINYMDYVILRNRLQAALTRDKHTGDSGEYRVRSLYFDTPGDKALKEKLSGTNHREKFRIRCYNNDYSYIKLEKKSKHNGLCYKQSAPLTRHETKRILARDYMWLKDREDELLVEFYSKLTGEMLRPKTIVDYIREPFIYAPGNVRITLDSDIRSSMRKTNMLDENLPLLPAEAGLVLLEVKYDNFIPETIVNLLRIESRRSSAFSKYALCRKYG